MDNLRSYMAYYPIGVTKYAQINAADGNTYKPGLTAGDSITANWYNNA